MKKSEANIEDLRNQTVSWGTHRPDDLIPKFMAVLKEYGKEAYDKYVSENPEVEDWKTLDDETKGWVVDELFDLLDGIAPEDCYFGAHPGDGADFGFWQVDESKRKDSKKSEAEGNKDIYTLDLTRIDAEGDEEGLDDMQAAQNFYDEDEAIQAAKDLADSYKDDDDVVQVTVMAGEQEKPNGDIVGEPFDIFTASSSDSVTTAKYREKANYTVTDGLDYYAKGSTSEGNDDDKGCKGKDCKDDKAKKSEGTDEEAFGKFEDAVKSILMDKYGVVDSHGPSDETANSLVLQYGATLRDAFDKGGENGYDPTSVALLIITRQLREAPQFFDDCKDFTFNKDSKTSESKKSESSQDWIAFYFCVDNRGDECAVYPHAVADREGNKVVSLQSLHSPLGEHDAYKKDYILDVMKPIPLDEVENSAIYKKVSDGEDREIIAIDKKDAERIMNASNPLSELNKVVQEYDIYKGEGIVNVKKSESLTLKQKELKNMARYGEATDITTISDAEAKELKKKGIETVGISRGAYGMNGALLRDNEGNKYVITARSSNLFYFV